MKIEEKIKNRFLYKPGLNLIKILYFKIQSLKKKNISKTYCTGAQDLLINYFFKSKKNGFYIDVGCYHPFNGNNTKLLYDKGWSGINIDLDFHTIDFFNYIRARDENINVAISDTNSEKDLYFFHNRSAINSLSQVRKGSEKEIKKIKAQTLNSVIENSKFKQKKLNFLSIDVEGHELEVLKGFDLNKYSPELVVVEFIDYKMKEIEFHNQSLNTIMSSEVYKLMINNNYHLVNWIHSDLFFVHEDARL